MMNEKIYDMLKEKVESYIIDNVDIEDRLASWVEDNINDDYIDSKVDEYFDRHLDIDDFDIDEMISDTLDEMM